MALKLSEESIGRGFIAGSGAATIKVSSPAAQREQKTQHQPLSCAARRPLTAFNAPNNSPSMQKLYAA